MLQTTRAAGSQPRIRCSGSPIACESARTRCGDVCEGANVIELGRTIVEQFLPYAGIDGAHGLCDNLARVGPNAIRVRVVGAPHEVIGIEVRELRSDRVFLKRCEHLAAEELAR